VLTAVLAASCALTGAASAQAAITIDSPVSGSYTNDLTPTVSFSGSGANEQVDLDTDVFQAGVGDTGWFLAGSTTSDDAGAGSITVAGGAIAGQNLDVFLRAVDTTTGLANGEVHVNIVPSLSSGFADGDTVTAADVQFSASGAIAGQDVALFIDGVRDDAATVTADVDGNVDQLTPSSALAAGSHTASVRSIDADGTLSDASSVIHFDVSPPAPAFTALFDGAKLNQSQPTLTVSGVDPGATRVTVSEFDSDSNSYVELVHNDGQASITPTLTDGSHMLVVTQTVAGVESVLSDNYGVTVTTSAPVLDPVDALGNDARPYFSASNLLDNNAGNDTKLNLYVDGRLAATDDNFGGGTDGVQPDAPLSEGSHTAYVTTVDDLGHEGVQSNVITFATDTVAPALPAAVSPADGSTVSSASPHITLHTEPGARVHLLVDDAQDEGDQTADANGNVTFTLSSALADGTHKLYTWAADAAGNATGVIAYSFVVKTATATIPAAPAAPATAAAPAAPVTPASLPARAAAAPAKVSLSSHTLRASKPVKVRFTLKKAATVKLTLTRVVKGKTVVVATIKVKAKAGKGSYSLRTKVGHKRLAKGKYKLTLQTVSGKKTSKKTSTQKLTVA
jgi:large repetitive protein